MESTKHWKGKIALEKILLEDDWNIEVRDGEDSFTFADELGQFQYWPDLLAYKDGEGWVDFEVDGKKGHSTKTDLHKMKLRDERFASLGIKTVRLKTDDLVGKKKQPIDLILREIQFQKWA
jgi:hypothetical protein